ERRMTNPKFFDLDVTVLEDLHTGTGTGSGEIDAITARDRYGWPTVRASHIKGLLREAGDDLIHLKLMRDQDLSALLGSKGQRRAALQLTSLRVVRNQDTPRNVHTVLWSSTAREPNTRVPKEDSLRAVEHVAAGTKFRALLRLNQA